MKQLGYFPSVGHIQDANKNGGRFFFEPNAMRGFRSRVHNALYGGCVFVSSEKENYSRFTPNPQRQYSVRVAMSDGSIERYGVYDTKRQADRDAQWLAKALANGTMVHCNSRNTFVESHLIHFTRTEKAVTLQTNRQGRKK